MSLIIAGHMSPMIRCIDGTIEEFPEAAVGLPLGVAEGLSFDVMKRALKKGETIVIYTDGVSEAMNPAGDLYGPERLREMIASHSRQSSRFGKGDSLGRQAACSRASPERRHYADGVRGGRTRPATKSPSLRRLHSSTRTVGCAVAMGAGEVSCGLKIHTTLRRADSPCLSKPPTPRSRSETTV